MYLNASLLSPPSNSSDYILYRCTDSVIGSFIYTAFSSASIILILPPSVLVLYLGQQRHRGQRSAPSHMDLFTYHMVTMELLGCLASVVYCCASYVGQPTLMIVSIYILFIVLLGRPLFHCLTCGERYLAVVHPVTYLGLRTQGAVRLRNAVIGCIWLVCLGWVGIMHLYRPDFPITLFFCVFSFFLLLISFFSISVLRTLVRPGPSRGGAGGGAGEQLKRRAFHTVTAILATLLVTFGGLLLCLIIHASLTSYTLQCVFVISAFMFWLPSSLVLPLLFLYRAGKLPGCRHSHESSRD